MKKSSLAADVLIAAGFIAVSGWVYTVAGTFPVPSWATVGAGFFPKVLAVLLVVLSIVMVAQTVAEKKRTVTQNGTRTRVPKAGEELSLDSSQQTDWNLGSDVSVEPSKPPFLAPAVFVLFVMYYLALPLLGYFLTKTIGVVALILVLGSCERVKIKKLLINGFLIAVGLSVFVDIVFQRLMFIRLPRGAFVRWLSMLL